MLNSNFKDFTDLFSFLITNGQIDIIKSNISRVINVKLKESNVNKKDPNLNRIKCTRRNVNIFYIFVRKKNLN